MNPQLVFVLGGPGAGKGTQCSKIAEVSTPRITIATQIRGRVAHTCKVLPLVNRNKYFLAFSLHTNVLKWVNLTTYKILLLYLASALWLHTPVCWWAAEKRAQPSRLTVQSDHWLLLQERGLRSCGHYHHLTEKGEETFYSHLSLFQHLSCTWSIKSTQFRVRKMKDHKLKLFISTGGEWCESKLRDLSKSWADSRLIHINTNWCTGVRNGKKKQKNKRRPGKATVWLKAVEK